MGNPVYGSEPDYSGTPFRPGEAIKNWSMGLGLSNTEDILRKQEEKKKKEAEKKAANIKAGVVNPDEEAIAAEKAARYAVKTQEAPATAEAAAPATVDPMGNYLGDYAAYLKDRRAEMAKDKEQNKYMALLQAGLGMMGGTSRYAGANIGQGASQGVAAYMAGQKQASADDRALQQGMLGLTRADLYNKMHSEDIARRKEAGLKSEEAKYSSQIVSLENAAERNAIALIGQDKLGALDPIAARAQVEAAKARILRGSKLYRELHKKLKIDDPFEGMDSGGGSSTIERSWSDLGKKK